MDLFCFLPLFQIICFVALFIYTNQEFSLDFEKRIEIPYIPSEHLLCWFKSLPKSDKDLFLNICRNKNFNLITVNSIKAQNSTFLQKKYCQDILYLIDRFKLDPCWGYENNSDRNCLLYKFDCFGSSQSWAANKSEQMEIFFNTADFGYVRARIEELKDYCQPNISQSYSNSSLLKCSKHIRYCVAKNIYLNLSKLVNIKELIRYREDVLKIGDIGGWNCSLKQTSLFNEGDHKSPLMSWFSEISNFKVLPNNVQQKNQCDMVLRKPTFIMKLDATVNMYHHFCDFLNLYLSFHLNGSNFNLDNNIIIWDSYPYRSNFQPVWSAFTQNPILNLNDFKGKVVCLQDVMFPLLPRMIYGLYYNMPLIPGCGGSGVFKAFNRHLLFHLKMNHTEMIAHDEGIKITFIIRNTRYRKVLNQEKMISSLKKKLRALNESTVEVTVVDFNHRMAFIDQVQITSKTDILIGMHGAGLTHTLFQPDYGVLFELYNCEDQDCYKDLSNLRGIHYMTWKNKSKLEPVADDAQRADQEATGAPHAKFVNYKFDTKEFVDLTLEAIQIVRKRKIKFRKDNKILCQMSDSSVNINTTYIQHKVPNSETLSTTKTSFQNFKSEL